MMSDIMRKNIGNINDDIPTGYKKTALGIIPEDWQVVKLGEILKIGSGRDYKHLSSGDIPVYGTGGHMLYVNDYLYDGDSVGIGRKGTIDKPQFLQGKFWTVDTLFYTYDFKGVIPKYLYSVFLTINWQQYNEASGVPSLSKTTIETIQIFLPSSSLEQQKITEILSFWDDSINKLEELINHKQLFKKGMMQQIFSQKLRFKSDDGGDYPAWEEKRLGDVVNINMGQSPSSEYYNNDKIGLPLIQGNADCIGRISSPRMFTTNITKTCDVGDTIMSVRAPAGVIFKSNHNACIGRGVCAIEANDYIYQYLLKQETLWKQYSQGSTFDSLNRDQIKNLQINIPSLPEQQKIANVLTCIDDEILLLNQQLGQLKVQKKSLMQKLLTGKIRVC